MVIGPEESPLPALRVARCGNWSWALGNGNVLLVEQGHGDAFKHEVDNEDDNEDDSRDYSEDYSEDYSYAAVMVRPPCARPVPALRALAAFVGIVGSERPAGWWRRVGSPGATSRLTTGCMHIGVALSAGHRDWWRAAG